MDKYKVIYTNYTSELTAALNNAYKEGYVIHTIELIKNKALMILPDTPEKKLL